MQLKGSVNFICEKFAYVMVNKIKIYLILTLKEPNFYLPAIDSRITVKGAHFIDENNILLCSRSIIQMTGQISVSANSKEFLKDIIEVIRSKQYGMLDIIKFHEYYENIMVNINFIAMKSPQQILIKLLKSINLDKEKLYKEQCCSNMLARFKLSSLWLYRYKEPKFIDGFNNWSFYTYNSQKGENMLVLLSYCSKYDQLQINDMRHKMICFITNTSEQYLNNFLNTVILINKFSIITEVHIKNFVNYAVFDVKDVRILCTSMMNLSTKPPVNTFKYSELRCAMNICSLESSSLQTINEANNINFEGYVSHRSTDFSIANGTSLKIDDVTLNSCENKLYGIIPQMKVLVMNAQLSNSKLMFKKDTRILLLDYIDPINTLDVYHPNWWMNSNYVIHDPDNVPYNTFVIFRAIAIEISELSIKWNCDTLEEETKYDDCVDSTIKFTIRTINTELDAITCDINLLKIILNLSNFRFNQWCKEFAYLQDYTWKVDEDYEYDMRLKADRYRYGLGLLITSANYLHIHKINVLCKKLESDTNEDKLWYAAKIISDDCDEY